MRLLCLSLQIFHAKKATDELSPVAYLCLRCSPKLVLKLGYDSFDFAFGATSRVSILSLEQDNETVAPPIETIDFIGTELIPVAVDFITELLPLCFQNTQMHYLTLPLTDMFLR